jgi:hypothetical protein
VSRYAVHDQPIRATRMLRHRRYYCSVANLGHSLQACSGVRVARALAIYLCNRRKAPGSGAELSEVSRQIGWAGCPCGPTPSCDGTVAGVQYRITLRAGCGVRGDTAGACWPTKVP